MKNVLFCLLFISLSSMCYSQTCPDNARWLGSGLFVMNFASPADASDLFGQTTTIELDGCTDRAGGMWECPTNLTNSQPIGSFRIPNGNQSRIRPIGSSLWRNLDGMGAGVSGGMTGAIVFSLTNGRTLTCDYDNGNLILSTLPVELSKFEVVQHAEEVEIVWTTTSEINSSYIAVERSSDGRTFDMVDKVMSEGNTDENRDYSVLDADPLAGTSYYRLQQVDLDGTVTYSDLRSIKLDSKRPTDVKMYPSHISNGDYLTIEGNSDDQQAEVSVVDMMGAVTYLGQVELGGTSSVLIDGLTSGIYVVQINVGDQQVSQRLYIK